jgi:anti-sigma B factor antagonist
MTTLDDARRAPTTLSLDGELDLESAATVRERLHGLLDDGALHLHIDLGELSFIDSRGLGVLIGVARRLHEQGGSLVVSRPTPPVQRVFEVTRLDQCHGVTVLA